MGFRRSFVVAQYQPDVAQRFRPEIPREGPCKSAGGRCLIWVKAWRLRSTGPCFPLCVVRCRTHAHSFTLYPPGHVPHGRRSWVDLDPDLDPDGMPVACEHEQARMVCPVQGTPHASFAQTYFKAALDGAAGLAWAKASEEGSLEPRFETQRRHLARCCALFALDDDAEDGLRQDRVAHDGRYGIRPKSKGRRPESM